METVDYTELKTMLERRLEIIADTNLRNENPEEQLRLLGEVSEQITDWHKNYRSTIPAQLNHFLTQSSLSKALEYIQNEI